MVNICITKRIFIKYSSLKSSLATQTLLTKVGELKLRCLLARGEGADVLEAVVDVGDPEPVDLGARVEVPREHDRVGRRRHHRQIGRHDLKMK